MKKKSPQQLNGQLERITPGLSDLRDLKYLIKRISSLSMDLTSYILISESRLCYINYFHKLLANNTIYHYP